MDMDIMHADEAKICTPVCSEEWLAPISHQRHFPVTPQAFCPTRAETPSEDPQFCTSSVHYPPLPPRPKVKRQWRKVKHSGEKLQTQTEHETLLHTCSFSKIKDPGLDITREQSKTLEEPKHEVLKRNI